MQAISFSLCIAPEGVRRILLAVGNRFGFFFPFLTDVNAKGYLGCFGYHLMSSLFWCLAKAPGPSINMQRPLRGQEEWGTNCMNWFTLGVIVSGYSWFKRKIKKLRSSWCCWQRSTGPTFWHIQKLPGGKSKIGCLLSANALAQENTGSDPSCENWLFSFRRSLQETCVRLINLPLAGMPCGGFNSSSSTLYKISALLYCEASQQQHKPFGSNAR